MTPNLSRFLGKVILVSIPAMAGDTKCQPFTLKGVELIGLWLESAGLSDAFLKDEHRAHASVRWSFFVPFTQIACVAIAVAEAPSQAGRSSGGEKTSPRSAPRASSAITDSTASATSSKKPKSK